VTDNSTVKHPMVAKAEQKKRELELEKQEMEEYKNRLAEETKKGLQEGQEKINKATLEGLYKVVEKYLYINDRNRIDIILATALSNKISGTPIWMFIVGNSGDWKSAFARGLEGLSHVVKIDQITKNTLASGQKGADDLGKELDHSNKILFFPDMAVLTSINKDDKNVIWGQFRNLYDGFINKKTGSGVNKKYEGCHVTIIACTTQAIRNEILIHAQLGTRELMYDTCADMVDNDLKMSKAWENEKFEEEMQEDIQQIVSDFVTYHKIKDIEITQEIKEFLMKEANRLSILRATGMTDKRYNELYNPVYPEVPTRLIKQFKRIYVSLKSLDSYYPDKKCKEIISHIVDSSGNKVRQLILKILEKDKWFKIHDVKQLTKLGRSAVKAQLEMLWNLNVVEKEVREERIGGYVFTNEYGGEERRGGRMEEVSYYRKKVVMTHSSIARHTHHTIYTSHRGIGHNHSDSKKQQKTTNGKVKPQGIHHCDLPPSHKSTYNRLRELSIYIENNNGCVSEKQLKEKFGEEFIDVLLTKDWLLKKKEGIVWGGTRKRSI